MKQCIRINIKRGFAKLQYELKKKHLDGVKILSLEKSEDYKVRNQYKSEIKSNLTRCWGYFPAELQPDDVLSRWSLILDTKCEPSSRAQLKTTQHLLISQLCQEDVRSKEKTTKQGLWCKNQVSGKWNQIWVKRQLSSEWTVKMCRVEMSCRLCESRVHVVVLETFWHWIITSSKKFNASLHRCCSVLVFFTLNNLKSMYISKYLLC